LGFSEDLKAHVCFHWIGQFKLFNIIVKTWQILDKTESIWCCLNWLVTEITQNTVCLNVVWNIQVAMLKSGVIEMERIDLKNAC